MPSLLDMLFSGGGQYPALLEGGTEAPSNLTNLFNQRGNSLMGLGLGLMSGGWGGGMKGYLTGAENDAQNAYRAAILRNAALDRLFREKQAGVAQSQWERSFQRSGILPAEHEADVLGLAKGSPERQRFLESKIGPEGDWSITNVDEVPYWVNKRTRQVMPVAPTGAPDAFAGGGGAVGYGQAGMGPGGFGTGGA